jgi:dipeptidyl aminopeptidase/acylaminoacyl peptidase
MRQSRSNVSRAALILLAGLMLGAGCARDGGEVQGEGRKRGAGAPATPVELIPRKLIFGNPERAQVQISPDGKYVSYLAPRDGVMNVYVAPADDPNNAKPVTNDRTRGIPNYFWAYDSKHVLYVKDQGGNENWNVFSVAVDNPDQPKNLTPNEKVAARIAAVSDRHPESILVGINDRDPRFHDLYRVNIATAEKTLLAQNPGQIEGNAVSSFMADDDYNVRFAAATTADGGMALYQPKGGGDAKAPGANAADAKALEWALFDKIGSDDTMTTEPQGFDKTGRVLYMADSRGRDTGALYALDLKTKEKKLLAEDRRADIGDVLLHPTEKTVQAVSFNYTRQDWKVLDKSIQKDLDYLKTVADGDVNVGSRTLDDKTWIVTYVMDEGPVRYYRYDRPAKKAHFLFTNRKALENLPLAKMYPVVIKSRDGIDLVSYLTLPKSAYGKMTAAGGSPRAEAPRPRDPLPMVLLVHGGPWGRDVWGFNSMHQWLANRGYAVLSVNFRGSTGFGKKYVNAGNREWAGKMHDDLIDAVNWAVKQGIADKNKVGIMGGSYGGFATLVGLTFTPDVFACGVDIVGPSRIVTLFETIPPYWVAGLNMFKQRVGDHTTEEGRKFLDSRSPLTHVDRIKKPLLIGQGANDPRVKQSESDQIVKAMKEKNLPVVYVLYKDEGHGFQKPENRLSFNAVTEQFLAEHLGGRAEPIGEDFKGSSIAVPEGAQYVKGVTEALGQGAEQPASSTAPAAQVQD